MVDFLNHGLSSTFRNNFTFVKFSWPPFLYPQLPGSWFSLKKWGTREVCMLCLLYSPCIISEHGFIGYSPELLWNNTLPSYSPGESFFTVFGVFFPAATGTVPHNFLSTGGVLQAFLLTPATQILELMFGSGFHSFWRQSIWRSPRHYVDFPSWQVNWISCGDTFLSGWAEPVAIYLLSSTRTWLESFPGFFAPGSFMDTDLPCLLWLE